MAKYAAKLSDEKYNKIPEIERTSKAFTRSKVPGGKRLHILDVGCGTGLNAAHFQDMGHKVFGVDISEIAISQFCSKGFEGLQCDIVDGIPLPDNTFDLVYASDVIEHIDDYESFLKELYRVLRPSGQLVLSTINSSFWPFRLAGLAGTTLSEVQHPGHIRFFSKRLLVNSIRQAGFVEVGTSGRHMYLILSGLFFQKIEKLLGRLHMIKEMRFKTMRPFWHYSRYAEPASPFWADTIIVTAAKPR